MSRAKKLKAGSALVELVSLDDKLKHINDLFWDAFTPSEVLDLDEWSDLYRVLPRETSSEYGQWSTDRFPFLRRIMKCSSPSSRAREIVAIKGCQLGFTEVAICLMCYVSIMDPAPGMYCQKTGDAAQDFSTQKLKPTIDIMPAVAETLGLKKSKSLSNSWDNKGFPGGFWVMGGANSGAFLRSKSIKYAVPDEEDSYEASIDQEGSPVGMIRKRMVNFPNSKMLRISTPKIKETSTIEPAYEAGSQEKYYLPCPQCGGFFVLLWDQIKWSKELEKDTGIPADIWCECPHCAGRIDEHEKTGMLLNGCWMSEKGSPGEPYEVGDVEFPSFHISSLYSPFGFFSWRDAVKEWFDWKRTNDVALLQVFINQTLGESWSLVGHDVSYDYLHGRREVYVIDPTKPFDVPFGGLVLTAGVDVQGDRLEVEVVAWGLFEESWSIDYKVFPGNPEDTGDAHGINQHGQPTVWRNLDTYLMKRFKHETGQPLAIECTSIDAQYYTEQVNLFCKPRFGRNIFPTHGKEGWGKGYYLRPKKPHERYKTMNFLLYVDELKNKIQSMLLITDPGPGYCHYPKTDMYNKRYFQGLTAESKQTKYVNGKTKLYWHCPSGARNEPFDCRVYAYGAALIYSPDLEARSQQMARFVDPSAGAPGVAIGRRRRRGSRVVSPGL